MDVSGDVADLMVKESIQLTEASIKLLAAGGTSLAALLWALAKEDKKLVGKAGMGRLLRENKELKVFQIKESDLAEFRAYAKKNVLYSVVKDKRRTDGVVDLVTNVDFVSQVNLFMERRDYGAPAREDAALPPEERRTGSQKKPSPALGPAAPHHSAGVARRHRRARGGRRGLLTPPPPKSGTSPLSKEGWPPCAPRPRA